MNDGRRTWSGIIFFISEITMFEQISTNVAAAPIPIALDAIVVIARVGHMPSSVTSVGFSFISPFVNSFM